MSLNPKNLIESYFCIHMAIQFVVAKGHNILEDAERLYADWLHHSLL